MNGTHLCTLMAEGDDARYDVTVTFTALAEDGSFDFDFQVADEPR
ncbi:hypothetical protein [Tessaracoccus coleopterorum]|nr:hypothetical protein [Tessaracoccus coleopterorum]